MSEYKHTGDLNGVDLTDKTDIVLQNPNGFGDVLDLATIAPMAKRIELQVRYRIDSKSIKFGSNLESFTLRPVVGCSNLMLSGNWNFAESLPNAKYIGLERCCMLNVDSLFFGSSVQEITMRSCRDFYYIDDWKLRDNGELVGGGICCVNFCKIAPNAKKFNLKGSDFSGTTSVRFGMQTQKVDLTGADLYEVEFPLKTVKTISIIGLRAPTLVEIDNLYIHMRVR